MPLLELKFDCDFLAGVGYGFGFAALAILDEDYAELAVLNHTVVCSFACTYRQAAALFHSVQISRIMKRE